MPKIDDSRNLNSNEVSVINPKEPISQQRISSVGMPMMMYVAPISIAVSNFQLTEHISLLFYRLPCYRTKP